jgi:hypothetical protein
MYLHIPPPRAAHAYDVVVVTLTHPRKILLVVLQTGKAKDLPAPLRIQKRLKYVTANPSPNLQLHTVWHQVMWTQQYFFLF